MVDLSWLPTAAYYLFFFIGMPILYLRMTYWQSVMQLEMITKSLAEMTGNAKKVLLKKIKKYDVKMKNDVNDVMEFFVIEPVSLDPYGIMGKIEHVINLEEDKLMSYVEKMAPELNSEEKADLMMGFSGALSLNQIYKIVRHILETVKKSKNGQLAMIYNMQMPMVERVARALLSGTEALTNGWPIGDSLGPMFAAHMIEDEKTEEIEHDVLMAKKKIKGKTVFILKAKGPGGRLGKLGKAAEKIIKEEKITKIITVDAAAKLEGEKTGSVAQGVGVAIGGAGVDRSYIENMATKSEMPLDTYVVKMSQEEAIMPIKKDILNSIPRVISLVEENISEAKGDVLLIGVGNTVGVGNDKKAALEAESKAIKILGILKERKLHKKKGFLESLFPKKQDDD